MAPLSDISLKDAFRSAVKEFFSGKWLQTTKYRNVGYDEFIQLYRLGEIKQVIAQYPGSTKLTINDLLFSQPDMFQVSDNDLMQKYRALWFGIKNHKNPFMRFFGIDHQMIEAVQSIDCEDFTYVYLAQDRTIDTGGIKKHIILRNGELARVKWEPDAFRKALKQKLSEEHLSPQPGTP